MKRITFTTTHLFIGMLLCLLPSSMHAWEGRIVVSTPHTSMVLMAGEGGGLRFVHFGDKVADSQAIQVCEAGNWMSRQAYPENDDYADKSQESSIEIMHADGNYTLTLIVEKVETKDEEDARLTTVTMKDPLYPVTVKMNYKAYKSVDMIEMWTEISHQEKKAIRLRRFDSGHFLIRRGDVWMSSLHGTWAAETQVVTERLVEGMKVIKNLDGARNGLAPHPEVMFSLDGSPRENEGRVIGMVLCWNGISKVRIDTNQKDFHHVFAGMNEERSEYHLKPGEVFTTPKMAVTYSQEGLSGASRNFHRWARKEGMVHGTDTYRDVLLNSWEGVYLNIKEPEMQQMMHDFAGMGGELFVMDDGWFGRKYPRNRDDSALGDWVVDTKKLPHGLKGLTDIARKEHIKFGIWIEPEYTNTKSELFEKHPEWVLKAGERPLKYGRAGTQVLLDMCNPKVQDFVFNLVDTLLTNYPEIAYIKWDANTDLKNFGSSYLPKDQQSHIYIDFHRGLLNVMQRIRAKYPHVILQACGSGGGRVGYGLMPYFDEFWVSDNTDALQRIYIQWGTSYFYPAIAMAQHVSAAPNHQTGRILPLKFRFDVAMTGRLGMEMQPQTMSKKDIEFSRQAIAAYKKIRPVIQAGNLYRLISPYEKKGVASLMYTNDEKTHAVLFAYKLEHFTDQVIPRFRLAGLDPDKNYRITEINALENRKLNALEGKVFSGSILMNMGIELQLDWEYASRILNIQEVI